MKGKAMETVIACVVLYTLSAVSFAVSGYVIVMSVKTSRETKRQAAAIAELRQRIAQR